MSKPPLDYEGATRADDARPQVRWQTVVSCSLIGMGLVCGLGAVVWAQRRHDLVAVAIALGVGGVLINFWQIPRRL